MSSTAAQNKFERIANAVGISDAGKSFLIAAVDPFHDEPITGLRGIPDGINSNSVVQIVRSSATVRAPAAVTTGTWDCHVQSLPITQECEQQSGVTPYRTDTGQELGTFVPLPGTSQNVGSITVNSGPTTIPASNLGIFGGGAVGQESLNINPSYNYTGGTFRVIAKGYEVISSGPQLYKSGVVYTYGLPVANSDITENLIVMGKDETGTLTTTSRNVVRLPDTPLNVRDTTIIPGSQSWPAKDGVYMVDRFNDPDIATFSSRGVVGYCLTQSQGGAPTSPAGMNSYRSWILVNPNVTNANFGNLNADYVKCPTSQNGADIQRMNLSGAFFTGLNPQDVLVINVVWYIERFPDDTNRDLLVLAKPTPHYEPNVMDMYSVIMGEMPWGMVQKANGFGDFFKDVVDVVSNTVAPALAALPGSAGIVGKVGTVGGKLLGGLLGGSSSSRNSEKVNPPSVYSENGKQKIFLEEVNPRVRELKNSQPKKKKKSVTSLLKKVSLGTKKTKKKKNR